MCHPRSPFVLGLVLWTVLAPALATGCSSSTLQDRRILQYLNQEGFGKRYQGNAQEQNYVTIGDSITYTDTFNDEVRGTEIVDLDGTIIIPEAGSVFVAGMTRGELESYLTQKLSPYFVDTDVKVRIRTGGAKVYYVWGEVRAPGPKPFVGDTTVLDAVLQAQPMEFTGNLGRVRVIRADPRNPLVIPVDVAAMWKTGDSTYNVQIQEFDIVYVPPTFLKQIADVVSGILIPIVSPLREIWQFIFFFNGGFFGGGGRGRRGGGTGVF